MPVLPIDLEAGTLGDLHAHFFGGDRNTSERPLGKVVPGLIFLADEANTFVTHDSILVRSCESELTVGWREEAAESAQVSRRLRVAGQICRVISAFPSGPPSSPRRS